MSPLRKIGIMRFKSILALALLLALCPLNGALAEEPILTGQAQPARVEVAPGGGFSLELVLGIAPKLHINGPAAQGDGLIPTKVSFTPVSGVSLAPAAFPPAHPIKVSFSDKPIMVYSGSVKLRLTGTVDAKLKPGLYPVKALVSYQACDGQMCYLPDSLEIVFNLRVIPGS